MNPQNYMSKDTPLYRASDIRKLLAVVEKEKIISFGGGLPDLTFFPVEDAIKSLETILSIHGQKTLQYSPTKGVSLFIETLKDYMKQEIGIKLKEYDDMMITTGSQQGLDLVARALIDPGDIIIVEKPTYLAALNAFRPRRPRFIGIEQDDDGMKTDELETTLRKLKNDSEKPKLIYTVPTNQNPAGTTMTEDRRRHLIELAEEYDTLILEDDPYSALTFEGQPPKPIKNLDETGRVIYMSTLSKTLSPGLRIGWMIGHKDLIDLFQLIKQVSDLQTSTISQFIAMEWIKNGIHKKLLNKTLPAYKTKRDAMLETMEEYFSEQVTWTRPKGGMFLFAYLPKHVNTTKMLETAIEYGVIYVPGEAFYPDLSGTHTMRLNFSYPSIKDIRTGIKILAEVIKKHI